MPFVEPESRSTHTPSASERELTTPPAPVNVSFATVFPSTTDVATLMVYGSYAALADIGGHGGAFAVLALPYFAVVVWLLVGSVYRQPRSGTPLPWP